jgi:replicative DNA helicase
MNTSAQNYETFFNDLVDRSQKYKLYEVLKGAVVKVEGSTDDVDGAGFSELVSEIEGELVELEVEKDRLDEPELLSDGLPEIIEACKAREGGIVGISCGMEMVDKYISGFCGGSLYVLAARPKCGKSMLLMNWALQVAQTEGSILYLDTEMTRSEVQTRSLAKLSGVPETYIKDGSFAEWDEQLEKVMAAQDTIFELPYFHKYTPKFKPQEIVRLAKKYKFKKDIKALFFDYIKMPELVNNISETQYLGELTSTLKDLAGILNIPVITAVQLGRVADARTHVTSSMVGESDRILRYCNVLLGLVKKEPKEVEDGGGPELCGTHRLQVLENRGNLCFFSGIDLRYDYITSNVTQADMQTLESQEEDSVF